MSKQKANIKVVITSHVDKKDNRQEIKENKPKSFVVSSANSVGLSNCEAFGRSFMYRRKRRGPRTLPCGTPTVIGCAEEFAPFAYTYWLLLLRLRTPLRTSSSNSLLESDSSHFLKTPTNLCSTAPAGTPRTPATTTPSMLRGSKAHLSSIALTTPRTPATTILHASDSRGTTPSHAVPSPMPCFARGASMRVNRTLRSSITKNTLTNAPSASLRKQLRQEDDIRRMESSPACTGVRSSKNTKDVECVKKEDDGKKKDNLNRVLSSSTLNVPTLLRRARASCSRLSSESRTPTLTKPVGRSSKLSVGSSTPTPGSSRRSSSSHARLSNHSQTPSVGLIHLTPDIVSSFPGKISTSPSPGVEDIYGGAESTTVFVGVRVRPISTREMLSPDVKNIIDVAGNTISITSDSGTVHSFSYDHCFNSSDPLDPLYASQEAIYVAVAQPLLEKAYEGYNTCLFAYGQTGSGKSYTMLGDDLYSESELEVPSAAGIIPRFCRDLLNRADYLHSLNPPEGQLPQSRIEVELSYIEIYNERIYDLLASGGGGTDCREALRVREHPKDGPYVEGVARHLVSSYDHLQTWLLLGNKERSIAATGVNEKSSRSHAVFTIKLTHIQVEDVEGEQLESSKVSIINLVDLAGSERVAAAQSQGDRLKEGVCINKSLLTLGKVITALAESEGRRRPFIPYRESVLTYLLKESLGGNSRTAMIATVSPCNIYLEETLSTLRYAQQTRKIVNHNYINEDPTAVIIRSLKEEVERLRLQHLSRNSCQLFYGETLADEEQLDRDGATDKEKDLLERENAINQKEIENNIAIQYKEEEIEALREQLRFQQLQCQQLLTENNRSLEQRLEEAEAQRQQALESLRRLGIATEKETGPVLINLSEDPQLSETLSYKLKNGITSLGRSNCDLTLRGLHTDNVHCSIKNKNGDLQLLPEAGRDTYVNGKLISSPHTLHHNDRLVLAGIYYFRFGNIVKGKDSNRETSKKMDFYFTKEELLKEQERRLQKEAEIAIAASKAEMEQEMCRQRDQLMRDIEEAQSQLISKQQLVCELEGTQSKLETEKQLLEEQILRDRKNNKSLDLSLPSTGFPNSQLLKEVQAVFNESVQEIRKDFTQVYPPMLRFQIKEANEICKKLKNPYEFTLQEVLTESGLEVIVLIKDLQHLMTATLTLDAFQEKLQILRDIVQNEEYDEVFEASLHWERTEDVSCVPGFINKLLDCPSLHTLNSSLNCSMSSTSSFLSRSNSTRKKSSMLYVGERCTSNSESSSCHGSVTVAAAIHWALTNLPQSTSCSPLTTALNAVADLHEATQVSHTDNFNKVWKGGIARELRRLQPRSKMLFADSSKTLVDDIAKLALFATTRVPTNTKFKPGGLLSKKFTDGLKSGLDLLVINSGKTANNSTVLLAANQEEQRHSQGSQNLSAAAHSATFAIAAFLKKFSQLDATLEYDENLPDDEKMSKIVSWVNRVESASDTIAQLTAAILVIVNQVTLSQQGKFNVNEFECTIKELKRRLEELMKFAGLSLMPIEGLDNISLSSTSDLENSRELMDNLHTVALLSIRAVEDLKNTLNNFYKSLTFRELKSNIFRCNKKLVTQWPRNSKEYQQHLEKLQHKSGMKSSLRCSSEAPIEEKRVRFDISSASVSSVSGLEETDTVDV
nr:LOW QUALITY PROTEIN: uncharacterized protein LOC128684368 [Cherax quadricarinatus]